MADRILQAVAIRRELIQGVGTQDKLHNLVAKYARANLYDAAKGAANARTVKRLTRDIARQLTQDFLPDAQRVAKASARPILDRLGGTKLIDKANILRGDVLHHFNLYHKGNLRAFHSELRLETRGLSGEIEAAFARAYRDGRPRKQLVADLVQSHKDEMKRIRAVRGEIQGAGEKLGEAEGRLAKASKRKMARARREVRQARKALTKTKAKIGTSKDFFARFETRVQGHARDAIRREAEAAQTAHFTQAGYKVFTWIAVNSGDACPECEARHGKTYTQAQARNDGPGKGGTYCGQACMCLLVPKDYHKAAKGIEKPLKVKAAPVRAAWKPPKPKPPKKLKPGELPKYREAKTIPEAEAFAQQVIKPHPDRPYVGIDRPRHSEIKLSDFGRVRYDGLTVETANQVNRDLLELAKRSDKLGIPRIRGVITDARSAASASMGDGVLTLNPTSINAKMRMPALTRSYNAKDIAYCRGRITYYEKEIAKGITNKKSLAYAKDQLRVYKTTLKRRLAEKMGIRDPWRPAAELRHRPGQVEAYFGRPADRVKNTLEHEFGHQIHQQYAVQDPSSYMHPHIETDLRSTIPTKVGRGGIFVIDESQGWMGASQYSVRKDVYEWFAENYSLWTMGRKELVPKMAADFFKKYGF